MPSVSHLSLIIDDFRVIIIFSWCATNNEMRQLLNYLDAGPDDSTFEPALLCTCSRQGFCEENCSPFCNSLDGLGDNGVDFICHIMRQSLQPWSLVMRLCMYRVVVGLEIILLMVEYEACLLRVFDDNEGL